MTPGWTGGQYSLLRALLAAAVLGLVLAARDAMAAPPLEGALGPWFPSLLDLLGPAAGRPVALALAAVAAALLALGRADRLAAVVLAWLALSARDALPAFEGVAAWPLPESLLLLHAFTPAAPYGSLAARGRPDPGGGWTLPPHLHAAAWLVVGLAHLAVGAERLADPAWRDGARLAAALGADPGPALAAAAWAAALVQVAFLPLAVRPRLRAPAWAALTAGQALALLAFDAHGAGAASVVAHLALADPAWLPGRPAPRPELLFYDGDCGLCHRAVRFLLAEDRGGAFRFAPLQGPVFERAVPPEVRAALPDSLVLQRADGALLERFAAVRHLLARLGGAWRALGALLALVPRPLGDLAYDGLARVRHRLFAKPAGACPLVPPDLRDRFVFEAPEADA